MKKQELKHRLQQWPAPTRLRETQQLCADLLQRQRSGQLCEERTGFWQFLADVLRHTGPWPWAIESAVLLLVCAAVSSMPHTPVLLPALTPLFMLTFLPALYESKMYGMSEIEAATRASGAQIILAKLILFGAFELVCITIAYSVAVLCAEYPFTLIQLALYGMVPFLLCTLFSLWSLRTCARGVWAAVLACVGSSAACITLGTFLPRLYSTSALGIWFGLFAVFLGFFIKEIVLLINVWKEGKMYGIIA